MPLNTLTSNLRAKTDGIPLHWWKLIMICKALLAPAIGALVMVTVWHYSPDAPLNFSNTADKVIVLVLCFIASTAAAASVMMWRVRKVNRPMNFIAILVSGATGALASTMIFTIITAH